MNSRLLLNDLISTSKEKGLIISSKNSFKSYKKIDGGYLVETEKKTIFVEKIALCNGANIADFVEAKVKKSYAPMAVISNVAKDTKSFVELDYYPKNCINIIVKDDGIALIGGISFNDESKCKDYIKKVFSKHKEYQPQIKNLGQYNGVKSEITLKGENRNYLYHIKEIEDNVWMILFNSGKIKKWINLALKRCLHQCEHNTISALIILKEVFV
jgi:L-rhamnose mutarotase